MIHIPIGSRWPYPKKMLSIGLEFKPQDLWMGAFWKRGDEAAGSWQIANVWVCLVPMLPIHLTYEWMVN